MNYDEVTAKYTARTIEEIKSSREQVKNGDLSKIKEMLFDSTMILHTAALASIKRVCEGAGHSPLNLKFAMEAISACKEIFVTLADYADTTRLSRLATTLMQENMERIMVYIARKGGKVFRYELLASRVIQNGSAKDYERCINALREGGYIEEKECGRRKNITYSIVMPTNQVLLEMGKDGSVEEISA